MTLRRPPECGRCRYEAVIERRKVDRLALGSSRTLACASLQEYRLSGCTSATV
jgi:hypothetical protein